MATTHISLATVETNNLWQIAGCFMDPWHNGAIWYDAAQNKIICWEGIGDGGSEMFPLIMGTRQLDVAGDDLQLYLGGQLLTLAEYCQQHGQAAAQDNASRLTLLLPLLEAHGFNCFFVQGLSLPLLLCEVEAIEEWITRAAGSEPPYPPHRKAAGHAIAGDDDNDLPF